MKMFLIIYCEAADEDVNAALKEAGIHGYTKMVNGDMMPHRVPARGRRRSPSSEPTAGPERTTSC
jgi:hypothetical protein